MARRLRITLVALTLAAGCAAPGADAVDLEDADYFEGTAADEGRTEGPADFGKADRVAPYARPEALPELVSPEIVVSLEGLTVHLFDRATGFSRVYPTGVGVVGRSGRSITPTGHFETGPDTSNGWWYTATRWEPAYFEGYPFLRLTVENSRGYNTYGLHGPITDPLMRGYVSHGCMRMAHEDIVELFHLVRDHASTPVTIQQEIERDALGQPVDVGVEAALYPVGARIEYGDSVGPREVSGPVGFTGDACLSDDDCGRFAGGDAYFCHAAGFCTIRCEGYCDDRAGYATTFCVADPDAPDAGVCVPKVDGRNAECALVPGTAPEDASRFVGESAASESTARVCNPVPAL